MWFIASYISVGCPIDWKCPLCHNFFACTFQIWNNFATHSFVAMVFVADALLWSPRAANFRCHQVVFCRLGGPARHFISWGPDLFTSSSVSHHTSTLVSCTLFSFILPLWPQAQLLEFLSIRLIQSPLLFIIMSKSVLFPFILFILFSSFSPLFSKVHVSHPYSRTLCTTSLSYPHSYYYKIGFSY